MGKRNLNDLIDKLSKIKNNLAEIVAPDVNKLFKESVTFSLVDWYNSYDPHIYKRTNNFMSVVNTARTTGTGNIITMSVDSSLMNDYPGFEIPPYEGYVKQSLNASTAFDYFFMNGEHGHGRWLMKTSLPPYMYVDADIIDGFGGRVTSVVNAAISKIMKG